MLSISLGPVALPVAPVLMLLAVWGASWLAARVASGGADKGHPTAAGNAVFNAALIGLLAARLAHLVLHADLYATTPWSALDLRDELSRSTEAGEKKSGGSWAGGGRLHEPPLLPVATAVPALRALIAGRFWAFSRRPTGADFRSEMQV